MTTNNGFGCSQLLENPGFTAVALLTLALGIGVCTTAFTGLDRLLLQALPHPEVDRLVVVCSSSAQSRFLSVSPADYCYFPRILGVAVKDTPSRRDIQLLCYQRCP
jgi:putative ABC transport system permease protein